MSSIIRFPDGGKDGNHDHTCHSSDTDCQTDDPVDVALAQDPYYRLINRLLHAIHDIGLPLDRDPDKNLHPDKLAYELYTRYQRENLISQWKQDAAAAMARRKSNPRGEL